MASGLALRQCVIARPVPTFLHSNAVARSLVESSEASRKREITMKRLLGLAAVLEVATGLALIIDPPLLSHLLLGEGVSGAGIALGHVAGFALVGLGLACWPRFESAGVNTPGSSSAAHVQPAGDTLPRLPRDR